MDLCSKQGYPGSFDRKGSSCSWSSSMGYDTSMSPGTVIRPDTPIGSGPEKTRQPEISSMTLSRQNLSGEPRSCPPMKRPIPSRCEECSNVSPSSCTKGACGCMDEFPIGMTYVPWQTWKQVCSVESALDMGTIFPELCKPFMKGGCRR